MNAMLRRGLVAVISLFVIVMAEGHTLQAGPCWNQDYIPTFAAAAD